MFTLRPAVSADAPSLERLIDLSARALSPAYSTAQIEGALGSALGLDRTLIADGTYFVAEAAPGIVGCGGWSLRRTRFGSDAQPGRSAELLDPAREAARIRAFFVHPNWARKGIGGAILGRCERDAAAQGFTAAELVATLAGEALYRARGYIAEAPFEHRLPCGVDIRFVPMRKGLLRDDARVATGKTAPAAP